MRCTLRRLGAIRCGVVGRDVVAWRASTFVVDKLPGVDLRLVGFVVFLVETRLVEGRPGNKS